MSSSLVSSGLIYHIDPFNKNCYRPFLTNSSAQITAKNPTLLNLVDSKETTLGTAMNMFTYQNGVIRINNVPDQSFVRNTFSSSGLQTSLVRNVSTISMWLYMHGSKVTSLPAGWTVSDRYIADLRRYTRPIPFRAIMKSDGTGYGPYVNTEVSRFSSVENGTYTVSASSVRSELSNSAANAFNIGSLDYYQSALNKYTAPADATNFVCSVIDTYSAPAARTNFTDLPSSTTPNPAASVYLGEWIQIQIPVAVPILYFTIKATDVDPQPQSPRDFAFFGSNDGVTFVRLRTDVSQTFSPRQSRSYWPLPHTGYRYYRLAVNKVQGTTGGSVTIMDLTLFYEFPTGEDSVYNSWLLFRDTLTSSGTIDTTLVRSSGANYWDNQSLSTPSNNLYINDNPITNLSVDNLEVYGQWRHLTFVINAPVDVAARVFLFTTWNWTWSLNCSFGPIYMYNRAITRDENIQNYNVYKNRFISDLTNPLPASMYEDLPSIGGSSTSTSLATDSSTPSVGAMNCPPNSSFVSTVTGSAQETADKYKVNDLGIILIVVASVFFLVIIFMLIKGKKKDKNPFLFGSAQDYPSMPMYGLPNRFMSS